MFHTDDNYTTILQRICLDILCNKTSGTTTDFTNVCEFLITCPLEAGRNYQITEHVNSNAPNVSSRANLIQTQNHIYSNVYKSAPSLPLLGISGNARLSVYPFKFLLLLHHCWVLVHIVSVCETFCWPGH